MPIHKVKMPFSRDYPTYRDWKRAHPADTPYNRRITGEHKLHPRANLTQLRGHPEKRRKPVTRLKPKKERKKPVKMQVVISGNIVLDDRSQTATNVYYEAYIQSARDPDAISDEILEMLKENGINVYARPDDDPDTFVPVTVAFRENVPKKGEVTSQKTMKANTLYKIKSSLHPVRPRNRSGASHHSAGESARRKQVREETRNEKKRRYDENEY